MVTTRSGQQHDRQRRRRRQQPRNSDRSKWEFILNALSTTLQQQHLQLHSLSQQLDFFQQCLLLRQNSWHSHRLLLTSRISKLQRQLDSSKLPDSYNAAKADLFALSRKRDNLVSKLRLEENISERDDFKACFDILSQKWRDQKNVAPGEGEASEQRCKMLEEEVATLRLEYEKLSLKYTSEVSSLRAEIKFAWNQYNEKESALSTRLQAKNDEVSKANEKTMALVARLEQLQSLNLEKDQTISTLRAIISRSENEARQKDEMIARCSEEPEILKSKRANGMPTLKRCSVEPSPSSSKRRRTRNGKILDVKEGPASAHLEVVVPKEEASQLVSEKGDKRKKRKQEDVINIDDTPKLFTSQFKVPKLKSQSPRRR